MSLGSVQQVIALDKPELCEHPGAPAKPLYRAGADPRMLAAALGLF
jgi:hypothetical protein